MGSCSCARAGTAAGEVAGAAPAQDAGGGTRSAPLVSRSSGIAPKSEEKTKKPRGLLAAPLRRQLPAAWGGGGGWRDSCGAGSAGREP